MKHNLDTYIRSKLIFLSFHSVFMPLCWASGTDFRNWTETLLYLLKWNCKNYIFIENNVIYPQIHVYTYVYIALFASRSRTLISAAWIFSFIVKYVPLQSVILHKYILHSYVIVSESIIKTKQVFFFFLYVKKGYLWPCELW